MSAPHNVRMVPDRMDLTFYAGDGFDLELTFIDKSTGAPWPVPGAWSAQVRKTKTATEVLAQFVVNTTQANDGKLKASLSGDDTRAVLTAVGQSTGVWDIQQVPPGMQPRTWYQGSVKVESDVTR